MNTIAVTGGRDFNGVTTIYDTLRVYRQRGARVLFVGDADGADRWASEAARALGMTIHTFPADWRAYGRAAGPMRNRAMLQAGPELLVAFPGGRGTADCVKQARGMGIEVVEIDA